MAPLLPFDWQRMKPNFLRRYKWAWRRQYEDVCVRPVGHPELYKFLPSAHEISEVRTEFYLFILLTHSPGQILLPIGVLRLRARHHRPIT